MKAEIKKPEFTPIELSITIETKQELDAFRSMFGANVTIPDFLTKQCFIDESYNLEFSGILSELFAKLSK